MKAWFETEVRARSYELDAFGHVNHAVYLNYFEEARIRTLEDAGYPIGDLLARGQAVAVVRIEVDYLKEVRLGEVLRIRTRLDGAKRSSVSVVQRAIREGPEGPEIVCAARVVWVWLGENRRPRRVPDGVRAALEAGP